MIQDELNRDIENEVQVNAESLSKDFYLVVDNLGENLIFHSEQILEGLLFAASNVVSLNPSHTDEEIKTDISELTHNYSVQDVKHNYFLYDTSGTLLYNGDTESFDSVDMINEEDYLNNLYIQEFVSEIAINNSAAIPYFNIVDDELTHFVLYGRRIEGTTYVVANIVNLQIYSNERKNNIINNMSKRFENSEDTLFVLNQDGTILYHPQESLIGATINNSNDPLKTVLSTMATYVSENNEGLITYDYYGNSVDGDVETKIAYVKGIDEWDIIVGSTVTQDKYDEIISDYVDENFRLILTIKLPSYIIMIILSISIYLYLKSMINESQELVEKEEILYRKFADLTSEIILITDKQGEIIFSNNIGKKAIFGKRENTKSVFFDQILVEEEGYYILYGYTEDFFVKFVNEPIHYNNVEADLFIITDVTEKIKTERKLEALSLIDELTKLGNRRMMVKEYNEIVVPYVKSGSDAYLVMIDLDDFKSSNDSYGHSYGDLVLKNVASIFTENKDSNILIYRIGGDEFALIFLNQSQQEVVNKLDLLRKNVETYQYEKETKLSFSAGVTAIKVNDPKRRFSDYFDKADKLLYKSKKDGKHKTNI